ncbi:type ISP restriction/modification enzyme [Helicobacter sp. 11S02596-1]|uniref:type ISP restriction/modification enzyme n=1 Tax=Helicobacter sp. 11S02596-1 TaxID=1476194 RepID=UPI000BA54E00|nr:type ISP restriction/modification enzyme [Helicobacter sp. 11S02596-1]PAF42448.1 hypothetical protein BJI48_06455 [Helicobacter sp. 11S02596-1]
MENNQIGESFYENMDNKDKTISKITYKDNKIFINDSLYFIANDPIWEYKIGGYQVLDKYLKSHKGEAIDIKHFENTIKILQETIILQDKIQKIELI